VSTALDGAGQRVGDEIALRGDEGVVAGTTWRPSE
jgi:hypothetical protein